VKHRYSPSNFEEALEKFHWHVTHTCHHCPEPHIDICPSCLKRSLYELNGYTGLRFSLDDVFDQVEALSGHPCTYEERESAVERTVHAVVDVYRAEGLRS
jgi:hypothetical protein